MIKIEKRDDGFRAMTHVRRDIGVIIGASTPEGPWVSGIGPTPDEALLKLYQEVGMFYVMSLEEK